MSVVDNAIARLQDIVLSCTDTVIKSAPDYPIEDATSLPLAIAHITDGTGNADNASTAQLNLNLSVDVHFARVNIKDTYTRTNLIIPEFLRRLCGDPTLNGTVDTIIFPVSVTVSPAQWDAITTHMVSFVVPIKTLETPIATA
jgi:hypothetical protein